MTVISACQSVALRVLKQRPSAVFSSQDPTMMELADLANETAIDIMKKHDWQALTSIHTITGDGVTSAFTLPADYDRMLMAQNVQDGRSWFWNYSRCPDLDTWISIQSGNYLGVTPGWWMILGNQFQFQPSPSTGALAKFPYVSNAFAVSPLGVAQSAFSSDLDTFKLDERLLTLGLLWRFRAQKRLEYSEDMQNYEIALSEAMARDKGARVIRDHPRIHGNVHTAYPWPLGQ